MKKKEEERKETKHLEHDQIRSIIDEMYVSKSITILRDQLVEKYDINSLIDQYFEDSYDLLEKYELYEVNREESIE